MAEWLSPPPAQSMQASLPLFNGGAGLLGMPSNSGWYLREIWRDPYTNETLFYDPATMDGKDAGLVQAGHWPGWPVVG